MTYNIVVTAIHDSIIGETESYVCQLWGDKLVIDDYKFGKPRWLLYSGGNVVSVGDVSNLHAVRKYPGGVVMNYTQRLI